ncbi:MAG: hypothetical protein HQM06_13960 [Magnetococcales bacterium]|nr:hypothetical protein [Magnetococcales bacterium]
MKFASVRYYDVMEEIEALGVEHYGEVGQHGMQMGIDHGTFVMMDREGKLLTIVARRDDGSLAGYMVFFVQPFPHYRHNVRAVNDAVFLAKDCRAGRNTLRFFEFAEQMLRSMGVDQVFFSVKERNDYAPFLERLLGYTHKEVVYGKSLSV